MQSQAEQYQRRLVEEMSARKGLEDQFEARLTQMTSIIERKQAEMDTMAAKVQLPIDTDILRMRLQKDVEQKFRFELESRTSDLERTSDSLYETKRQLELIKSAHESAKFENEKFVQELRGRHKSEVD